MANSENLELLSISGLDLMNSKMSISFPDTSNAHLRFDCYFQRLSLVKKKPSFILLITERDVSIIVRAIDVQ